MLKRIASIGVMLVGLMAIAARAGEAPGPADATNLLPDIADVHRWVIWNPSGTASDAYKETPEDGSMRVDIPKKEPSGRGERGFGCTRVSVKAGAVYTLRFTAKGSEPRQITMSSLEPSKRGESIIGQAAIELKASWQTYVCRIAPTRDNTPDTWLPYFDLGDKVGTVWFRNVTLTLGEGGVPAAAPAPAPAPGVSRNLFPNAEAPGEWIVSQKGSARGSLERDDNQLRITVATAATERWNFRLQHRGLGITAGQTVTLKLFAKSSVPRKITISSQQAQPPMGDLTDEAVLDVGSEWQEFTCRFSFPKGTSPPNDLFPIIELGDQAGTVWLRDIVLSGGEAQSAAANTPPPPRAPRAGTPTGPPGVTPVSEIADMTQEGVWRLAWRGVVGTAHKEGDAIQVELTGLGQNFGIPALQYNHLQFPVGKVYRLKFSAKSEAPAQIKVVAQIDEQPYDRDYSTPVPLSVTGEWHDYDMTLTLAKPADADLFTLSFLLDRKVKISFRNMSLIPE